MPHLKMLSEVLFGGQSRHPASPPPFVQCCSHLWVEKFVGFNGGEEDKNGARKAFISKLKINSCDPEPIEQTGKFHV